MATVSQLRRIDSLAVEQYHMHSLQLMENAGSGAARWIADHYAIGRAVILCGPGNNGGDGFVVARHLDYFGFDVQIVLVADRSRMLGDALHNLQIAEAMHLPLVHNPSELRWTGLLNELRPDDLLIDALLGTGTKLPLRANLQSVIRATEDCLATRIALDIPTGLDADFGVIEDICFRANVTLTFAETKTGFSSDVAETFLGRVHVIPIGVPRTLLRQVLEDS